MSLPLRECGLKRPNFDVLEAKVKVTPLAGVWIETLVRDNPVGGSMSLPLRECGLKLLDRSPGGGRLLSLPLRECGLKHGLEDQIGRASCRERVYVLV